MMTNAEQTPHLDTPSKPWTRRHTATIIAGVIAAVVLVAVGYMYLLAFLGCC